MKPYMILNEKGQAYKHGYPSGSWCDFPHGQLYKGRSAASRQANQIKKPVRVVEVSVSIVTEG